jgi:hypothetical protein
LRWSLDHIFHSQHFSLVRMCTLSNFGSDHLPVFAHLRMDEPNALPPPVRAEEWRRDMDELKAIVADARRRALPAPPDLCWPVAVKPQNDDGKSRVGRQSEMKTW